MNKYILLPIFFLFACGATKEDHVALVSHPPNEYLTVILDNQSGKTIYVWMEESFERPDNTEYGSSRETDTLQIPLEYYMLLKFSHPETKSQELLVSRGDTLWLNAFETHIDHRHNTNAWFSELSNWVSRVRHEQENDTVIQNIKHMHGVILPIDSSSRPISIDMGKEKGILYGMKRTALENPDTLLIRKYLNALRDRLGEDVRVIAEHIKPMDEELARLLNYTALNQYHEGVKSINSFFPHLVHDDDLLAVAPDSSLLSNPYSRKLMQAKVAALAGANTSTSQTSNRPNVRRFDYGYAFDQLPTDWPDSVRKYAQFICIEMMVDLEASYRDVQERFSKFKAMYPEDRFTRLLENRYLMDMEKYSNLKEGLQLMTAGRKLMALDSLLKEQKGRLVYIDFWASWCVPCREAMPASHQLAKDYHNKDLVFIYVSTDARFDAWAKASQEERLDRIEHNYLIVNRTTSDFLQQIKLTSIPRYLLYDRTGRLVHQHAPGPKGQDIRDLLDKYLAE